MITYEQIMQANDGLNAIDVKGKKYVMVNEKVKAFRRLYPEGFIITDILSNENEVVTMRAKAGYYDGNGNQIVLGTGMAFEEKKSSYINKTSYIENCETSAIGRALSFMALGADDSIASAEELANAILNQGKKKEQEQELPEMQKAGEAFTRPVVSQDAPKPVVDQVEKLPPMEKKPEPEMNPVQVFLMTAMKGMRENRKISAAENNKIFKAQVTALINAKLAPKKKLEEYTMEEATALVDAINKCFDGAGTELKTE